MVGVGSVLSGCAEDHVVGRSEVFQPLHLPAHLRLQHIYTLEGKKILVSCGRVLVLVAVVVDARLAEHVILSQLIRPVARG